MMDRKYFKAFLGIEPSVVRETVVLSPIIYPRQFAKIIGEPGKHYKSILSYLIANFKNLTFIKTPMTQAAVSDVVILLKETPSKKVIFVGAIGALPKGIKIGDAIVSHKPRDVYPVNSFHEETKKKLRDLQRKGIIGIDFESRTFFCAAKKAKLSAVAYYVVTDLPLSRPFYIKRTKKEDMRIQDSIKKIALSL